MKPAWFQDSERRLALPYIAGLSALTVGILLWFGRSLWCPQGDFAIAVWDGGAHQSQHLVDPYSFTHVEHGVLFFALLAISLRRKSIGFRFLVAMTLAAGWEIVENSSWLIERFRADTIPLGYYGDSIVNALSDIAFAALGFCFAARVRWWWSVTLLLVFETALALTIHDNLLRNILLPLWPHR